MKIHKGDTVLVVQGDLAGIRGRVEGEGEGGLVMVRPEDAKLPGFTELVGFQPRELQKHFEPGTHVRVASGARASTSSTTTSISFRFSSSIRRALAICPGYHCICIKSISCYN